MRAGETASWRRRGTSEPRVLSLSPFGAPEIGWCSLVRASSVDRTRTSASARRVVDFVVAPHRQSQLSTERPDVRRRLLAASAAVAARPAASARSAKPVRRSALVVRASDAAAPVAAEETYEVTLAKPIGVKFARGNDGGAYVTFVPPERVRRL